MSSASKEKEEGRSWQERQKKKHVFLIPQKAGSTLKTEQEELSNPVTEQA